MPVFGKQDVEAAAAGSPLMTGFDTDPWELKDATILQLSYEITEEPAEWLIPPALHPSIPPYATITVANYPNTPVGPFCLAQVRIVVRAGIRPRGYLVRAFASTEEAAQQLRSRWGFTVDTANVSLPQRHDQVIGKVEHLGDAVLDVALENPEHISGSDITYLASLHLTRVTGEDGPSLVQVDPEYVFKQAQRGKPRLNRFLSKAWEASGRLRCTNQIIATAAQCDTDMPPLRFALDPSVPATEGSRRL